MSMSIQNAGASLYAANSAAVESSRRAVPQKSDSDTNVSDAKLPGTAAGISQAVRQSANVQILQKSAQVSIKAGEQSLALLYRSAVDRINDFLAPQLGANAIQNAIDSGVDTSPEATANRILSFSTAFFDKYAAQNPGKDPNQLATDFVAMIRGGFEKGFNEAKKILDGLGVLNGGVADGIQQTWNLVQKGYDDFLASKLSA